MEERSTLGHRRRLLALLDGGARRFLIALGGSSTNDGGIGLLVALGLKLLDAAGSRWRRCRRNWTSWRASMSADSIRA